MSEKGYLFSTDQLNRLFPFHLLLNKRLNLVSFGTSISKLCPLRVGLPFTDVFIIKRPGNIQSDWEDWRQLENHLLILESRQSGHLFRGQLEFLPEKEEVLFLGSPWFNSMDEVKMSHLTLDDFATHDSMIDLLHVLKTHEIVNKDMTELLREINHQKEKIATSSSRLSILISNLQDGVLLEDENRRIVLTNHSFCELFGIPAEPGDLIGADCSNSAEQSKDMFLDPEGFVERINELLARKELVNQEELELADGRVFERSYIPLFIDNHYRGHLWKYNDISSRKKQQYILQQSEEKYRGMIANMNIGLVELDNENCIRYVNNSFCHLSGYTEHELIGNTVEALFCPNEDSKTLFLEETSHRKKGLSSAYRLEVKIKSGIHRWWLISAAPRLNTEQKIVGSIGLFFDITDQKNLEQNLMTAKQEAESLGLAKERFLANMSHEIRTPLSGIYGMVRLLQQTELNDKQSYYAGSVEKAIDHLQVIINDILDFSRINAGMLALEEKTFSLHAEAEHIFQLLRPKAEEKNIGFSFSWEEGVTNLVSGDPHRLRQILINLLGNAIKFTEKGQVSFRCEPDKMPDSKEAVCFLIEDTGIGIDEDYLPHIFETFSREEGAAGQLAPGTGLGMSIAKQLTELMNGQIDIRSKKGKGTSVRVRIPLRESRQPVNIDTTEQSIGSLPSIQVLIAEDNEINRVVIHEYLRKAGARATAVSNGKQLIQAVRELNPDIIITDLQMPEMGGMEALRILQEDQGFKIPVIALTANAMPDEKERCLSAGFSQVVFKPFRQEDLLQAISSCLGKNSEPVSPGKPDRQEHSLYNLSELYEMLDQNEEMVQYLIDQFLDETPDKMKLMNQALHSRDYPLLKQTVHYLASSIHHLGISRLKDQLDHIHGIRAPYDTEKIGESVSQIEAVLNEVREALNKDRRH